MSTFLNRFRNKYLYVSILVLLIIVIYEQFSHGITSNNMRISFLFPFIGGFCITILLPNVGKPNKKEVLLWKMGIPTLTAGYFLIGVFEIYGSIDSIVYIYIIIGWSQLIISFILYLITILKTTKRKLNNEVR